MKKFKVSFRDFVEFKEHYLSDREPLLRFGKAFCQKFGIECPDIFNAGNTDAARAKIEALVEWVI